MCPLLTIAHKEFRDGLRHRWVLGIAVLLGVLALGIAAFGAAASGGSGFTGLSTTLISLSTLSMLLIPLIALMLAYDAIVGEDEGGTLLLLATYPMPRRTWLLGKFLGHAGVLGLATLSGFAVAGAVIAFATPQVVLAEVVSGLVTLIVSSVLLGWSFLAMAYWISTRRRQQAGRRQPGPDHLVRVRAGTRPGPARAAGGLTPGRRLATLADAGQPGRMFPAAGALGGHAWSSLHDHRPGQRHPSIPLATGAASGRLGPASPGSGDQAVRAEVAVAHPQLSPKRRDGLAPIAAGVCPWLPCVCQYALPGECSCPFPLCCNGWPSPGCCYC